MTQLAPQPRTVVDNERNRLCYTSTFAVNLLTPTAAILSVRVPGCQKLQITA